MKYAVKYAIAYMTSFIRIGSDIQKLLREINIQTHRQLSDLITQILFFKARRICYK
jgi:hypothetical protein